MPLTPAEKQQAYRDRLAVDKERERLAELDRGKPWAGLVGEEREVFIRRFYRAKEYAEDWMRRRAQDYEKR